MQNHETDETKTGFPRSSCSSNKVFTDDGMGMTSSFRYYTVFFLVIFLAFNSLVLTIISSRNVIITQENHLLLDKIVTTLIQQNYQNAPGSNVNAVQHVVEVDGERMDLSHRLVKLFRNDVDSCPPCPTTPRPDPVDGHKNPVGILNEATHTKAVYDCVHSCRHPVIHNAYLTIDDPSLVGRSWQGIGESKGKSKQDAAYKALLDVFPEHAQLVSPGNIPPVYRPPPCQVGPPEKEDKAKC